MGFTKLDDAFASSSIFGLGLPVVGFWAYLMSQADARGVVRATVPDMAARCRISPEEVERFLALLQQPDRWSRTPDNEGRRVNVLREPEWAVILLNHGKYRWQRDPEMRREQTREAVRRHREHVSQVSHVSHGKPKQKQKQKQKQKTETTTTTTADVDRFNRAFSLSFRRRATLPPDKAATFAARVVEGYPAEFLIGSPVAVRAAGLDQGREIQPAFLLRNGSGSYVRNGERRATFDWIGALWQAVDRLSLAPTQAEMLREVGVLDWWIGHGATVQPTGGDEC